jgi:5'-3' exonuclease
VRLGTAGWKERYYKEKFSVETWRDTENLRKEIVSFCYHKLFLAVSGMATPISF